MKTRDEFVKTAKTKLDEWNRDLDRLEARIENVKEERKARLRQRIDQLEGYRDDARRKLREIQEAGDDAWEELSEGARKSWKALNEGFRAALEEFRKEAPEVRGELGEGSPETPGEKP